MKLMMKKLPFCKQMSKHGCGPACLVMVKEFYGKQCSNDDILKKFSCSEMASIYDLVKVAETIGFKAEAVWVTLKDFIQLNKFPCIVWFQNNHYVVVYQKTEKGFYVADPGLHFKEYPVKQFKCYWLKDMEKGICIVFDVIELN